MNNLTITFNDNTQTVRRTDDGLVNLTDLWRAAGSDENKRPTHWARNIGKDFVEFATANLGNSQVWVTKPGRYGGVFSTREIAIAYAQWISPAFQMLVCKVFLDKWDSHPQAPAMEIGGLAELVTKVEGFSKKLDALPTQTKTLTGYVTIRQYLKDRGIQTTDRQRHGYCLAAYDFCETHGMTLGTLPSRNYENGITLYPLQALEAVVP